MSISAQALDFYDDVNREGFRKMAAPKGIGAVVFESLTPEELGGLPDDQFGLIVITKTAQVIRKYPVHDIPHTWLAGQYLAQNHEKMAAPAAVIAAHHIKVAARSLDVPVPEIINKLASVYPDGYEGNTFVEANEAHWNVAMTGQAKLAGGMKLGDDSYALVYQSGDGETIRKYAMPSATAAHQAIAWFEKYAREIQPEHRPRMARAIVKRATALGVDLKGFAGAPNLHKYAAGGWNPSLDAHLEQRKSLLPRDERARKILTKLAESLGESEPEDFARSLEAFDTRTGLRRYYGRGLDDAYSSTMGEKTASDWSGEVDGYTITEKDLRKAAAAPSFKQYFGETVKVAFERDPSTIFESLPKPHQIIIGQIARGEL